MKKYLFIAASLVSVFAFSQTGHIMQGIGSVNMSMGGAATAQPTGISGALYWNPATISTFNETSIAIDAGIFYSRPELSSTYAIYSGTTKGEKSPSVLPSAAVVFGKENNKHTFGISIFGVSGFGVDFPQSTTNPINFPQSMGGFGHLFSEYTLMQVGVSYAYNITDKLSVGINPILNYGTLELEPNPISSPDMMKGYPKSDKATAIGFGAQIGVFYDTQSGIKVGASYKSEQKFKEFEFSNTYLDGTAAPNATFTMNYPAIYSAGIGYSNENLDLALDYRYIDYANTEGFEKKGWTSTASVQGFGWNSISVISAGFQYKGIDRLPIRIGYTYSENPIEPELAFFSTPATAIIKNAFELGVGFNASNKLTLNANYHYATSGNDATSGSLLSPMMVSPTNPYGAIPNTSVSYTMDTMMLQFGIEYKF